MRDEGVVMTFDITYLMLSEDGANRMRYCCI